MLISIYNSSGIINIIQSLSVPRSYFQCSGSAKAIGSDYVQIQIDKDTYDVLWSELDIDGNTPESQYAALYMLAQVFANVPVNPPAEFISPILLFDFYQNTQYANGDTSIIDLSVNGNDGTPTYGNGVGTPESINNSGVTYNPTTRTMDFSSNAGNQHSISLPDYFKFGGTTNYTITLWFKRSAVPSVGNFQGLVASQGADTGMTTLFMNPAGTPALGHQRQNGNGGVTDDASIYFGTGGVQSFVTDTWYMVSFGYDGTSMFTSLYEPSGNRIDYSNPSTAVISTDPSWGAFLGLRYNNWLDGTNIGVLSINDTWIGTTNTDIIYNSTKFRYGY